MTGNEIIAEISSRLDHLYTSGEATAIAKGYVNDRLGIHNFSAEVKDFPMDFLEQDIRMLETGTPLQYVTGIQHFHGLKLKVNHYVLIPRPETEELTVWIGEELRDTTGKNILDIGTGSGCIPIVLKKTNPNNNFYATDISPEALEVAMTNSKMTGTDISFVHDSILDPRYSIPGGFDVIISNPPYIPISDKHEMHENVVRFEPHAALFVPDRDPILFYRAICNYATKHLKSAGVIYFEVHPDSVPEIVNYLRITGFGNILIRKDMSGKARFIKAIKHPQQD